MFSPAGKKAQTQRSCGHLKDARGPGACDLPPAISLQWDPGEHPLTSRTRLPEHGKAQTFGPSAYLCAASTESNTFVPIAKRCLFPPTVLLLPRAFCVRECSAK